MNVTVKAVKVRSGDAVLACDIYIPKTTRCPGSAIIVETGLTLNRHGLFAEFARYFAEHGFVTVVYDKRSHGDSTGKFTIKDLKQDQLRIINHIAKKHNVRRIGLFGFCYGGIPSMENTPDNPMIKVFAGIGTYNNYLELVLGKRKALPFAMRQFHRLGHWLYTNHIMFPLYLRNFHIAPLEQGRGFHGNVSHLFKELATCHDPIHQLRKIKKPFFLFYGAKDKLVPQYMTQRLYNTCPSRTKKLFTYDEAGHFFHKQRPRMLADCLKIYKKYLKG